MPAPKRRGRRKDFCRDRCRAAFALDQKRVATERLLTALDDFREVTSTMAGRLAFAVGEIERLNAVVRGLQAVVRDNLVVGHRPRKPRTAQPMDSPGHDSGSGREVPRSPAIAETPDPADTKNMDAAIGPPWTGGRDNGSSDDRNGGAEGGGDKGGR